MEMHVNGSRILHVDQYLRWLPDGSSFRVVAGGDGAALARAGLGAQPAPGQTVLPPAAGRASTFNAQGRWVIRKDLPKESRYIRTVYWTWQQWAGRYGTEEQEGFFDQYRDCYPRDFIAPPALELSYVEHNGQRLIVSPVLTRRDADRDRNKHAINLFLELFGSCELVSVDLAPFAAPAIKKANWRLLPPGEYPWERLKYHIGETVARVGEDTQRVIWDRQETLKSFCPDEVYVGAGGFNDYLAYVFRDRGLVVLESLLL